MHICQSKTIILTILENNDNLKQKKTFLLVNRDTKSLRGVERAFANSGHTCVHLTAEFTAGVLLKR